MANIIRVSEAATIALHTMVLLAKEAGRPLSTGEIADTFNVSEAHLSKVLQRLAHAGLVKSIRGPKGGFLLAKPYKKISLLNVYETIDGHLSYSDCLLGKRVCSGKNCIMGDLLKNLNREAMNYLKNTNLSDLISVYKEA